MDGVEEKLESLVRAVTSLEARFDERENGVSNDTDSIVSGTDTRRADEVKAVRKEIVTSDARLKMLLKRASSFARSTPREKQERTQSAWNRERQRQHTRETQR